ncbi:MAG: FAD-dependent oxidoreductase [Sphaerochaetaceae bacterium]|nr:FAD-dependent oxidoreductase [Sphaerochaetaceae bacterium]
MNKTYDVIITGAGPSGMAAALSAARNGASVLLIEKNGYPGGMNTAAMVCPLMTFHSGETQIIKGIAQEIVDRLAERGATLGHIPDPIGMVSTITPIDPVILKLVYFEMLAKEPNITTLFHTFLTGATATSGKVASITVVNKSGAATYQGRCFIDATGDADLAYLCKAEFTQGRSKDGMSQPMSLMFKMGGVELDKIAEYVRANPEQFILSPACDLSKYLAVSGFFREVVKAKENGDLTVPRDRVLFFQGIRPDEIIVNMTRVTCLSGVNAKDLTQAEFEAHRQVDEIIRFFNKYLPGFEHAYIQNIADVTGVRESRRIIGRATLVAEDILENRSHETSVAMCAFPIDIHDPVGNELNWIRKERACRYDIPFEVMVPKHFSNLLVAGRCISATHEALASARISPTAMALGEAAGLAAAMAADANTAFDKLDVGQLQNRLVEQNAIPGKKWLEQ